MKKLLLIVVVFILFSNLFIFDVFAHPGRTAADDCHYCRTNCSSWGYVTDTRHCHGDTPPVTKTVAPIVTTQPTKVYEPVPEPEPVVVAPIKTTPKIEVKEMDLEESYDYLNIPTSPEKPKTISKIEVPLEPAKASSSEGSSAAGVVVGLGGLAGAGYLIKKFRKK